MREIKYIVLHCTATAPSEDIGAAEVREWHKELNGWRDVGYHAILRRNGMAETGRPVEEKGAGVRGHNEHSIHIALVGGIKEDGLKFIDRKMHKIWGEPDANFTRAQYDSALRLIGMLKQEFPDAVVCGHRDFPGVQKACPCFDVKAWYGEENID